ncbi:MAG: cation:proton antiporter [Chloroflexota bacterium]|nr:cation:proton antiporter [Chloroflexota bacterium]
MEGFVPTDHHDILLLLVQIAVLLGAARLFGEAALRLNQPAVVGEILAGIVLGPSLLSTFVPFVGEWLVPHTATQWHLLDVVSLIGAIFLLLITGLETDLALIKHHARTAIGVSAGGILVTFATGFLLGQLLPAFLLADEAARLVFALFVATAMSISAIPVIAKVLMDLNLMRRDIGQIILAAGMSDDTTGWILLSIVAGLATGGVVTTLSVTEAIGSVLAFLLISFTAGRWLVKRVLDFVQDEIISAERLLTLVVVLTFIWGAITQALGLEAVLGAFVMGILFGQMPRLPQAIHHRLESVALGIFAPIFFAVAGLKVNLLSIFGSAQLIGIALLVIAVASIGKVVGTYLGARLIGGRDHWTALSFGAGLNARGAMEIIVASIGLSLGILTQDMYSIIVLMAMATSLMAPTALRWVLQRVEPEEQELERLRREELAVGSLIANVHRVLLPVRGPRNVVEAAHLVEQLATTQALSVTLLHVAKQGEQKHGRKLLDEIDDLFPSVELVKKVVAHDEPAEAILAEAKKDYDLLLLGAPAREGNSQVLFAPIVDYLMRLAPCPTIVVKGAPSKAEWPPKQILVPTDGSAAARRAAEVGFALASADGSEVTILNVVRQVESAYVLDAEGRMLERQMEVAGQVVHQLRELAEARGVESEGEVRTGRNAESVILEVAEEERMDLIVLGTDLKPGTDRLFLGPRVETILAQAPCMVVVVNAA